MAISGMTAGGILRADINMTPMIDVLLVLIIIFMVITPLVPKGLEALVPQTSSPRPPQRNSPEPRTVVIVIHRDGSMALNREPVTEDRLGPRLLEIFSLRAERVVFVQGDPALEYQQVAQAIDIAHGAGIDKIGLLTTQTEIR